MAPITRNDVAEHLSSGLDWQARVAAYATRDGKQMPEAVRQGVLENRAQAYRMADLLGINLNRCNEGSI